MWWSQSAPKFARLKSKTTYDIFEATAKWPIDAPAYWP